MKLFLLVIKDFWLQETDIKIILYTVLDPKCFHLAIDVLGSPIPCSLALLSLDLRIDAQAEPREKESGYEQGMAE